MRLVTASGADLWLAYCMNVHPGGTVQSFEEAVRTTVQPLKARLGAKGPFGVGLRFTGDTVSRLRTDPRYLALLQEVLRAHRLVPFTANGFVVGAFHGEAVKENVYAPAWTTSERVRYTVESALVLAALASAGDVVSLSTAPGSWRAWGQGPEVDDACARQIAYVARRLAGIEEETGVSIRLGLEPEPGCTIQTVEEAVAFFAGPLARALGDDERPRRHVGVCFDVCHLAVVHEDVGAALDRLAAAGVPVAKVQASSALELPDPSSLEGREALRAFDEPVYLHQVGAKDRAGRLHVAPDLPEVLADPDAWVPRAPWRVHFHVPVFRDAGAGPLRTTRAALDVALERVASGRVTPHLEIETYTFDVLPAAERRAGSGFDLVDALEREYRFVLGRLGEAGAKPADGGRP
jgi:hypothetical protein